jgi:hypothetical protein
MRQLRELLALRPALNLDAVQFLPILQPAVGPLRSRHADAFGGNARPYAFLALAHHFVRVDGLLLCALIRRCRGLSERWNRDRAEECGSERHAY